METLARYALSIGAAAALLAGCGGSEPPAGTPGVVPMTNAKAWTQLPSVSRYKSLYSFQGLVTGPIDGSSPSAKLIVFNGTLYGTTASGGTVCGLSNSGCGAVFSITPSGSERVLYRFKGQPSDGA